MLEKKKIGGCEGKEKKQIRKVCVCACLRENDKGLKGGEGKKRKEKKDKIKDLNFEIYSIYT